MNTNSPAGTAPTQAGLQGAVSQTATPSGKRKNGSATGSSIDVTQRATIPKHLYAPARVQTAYIATAVLHLGARTTFSKESGAELELARLRLQLSDLVLQVEWWSSR